MTDISYKIDWNSMSDQALIETIGAFIKEHRLNQNKSQEELALDAGISRSTLSSLENGKTVTIDTFIRVLRVLDLLYIMNNFQIKTQVSPIALAKMDRDKRKRARRKDNMDDIQSDW